MHAERTLTGWTVLALALVALPASAGSHTSRTYFGRPGLGPYGEPQRYHHPWTAKVMGIRCCVTPEERYEKFLQQYQITMARHQVALNRLNWDAYYAHANGGQGSPNAYLGQHNCGGKGTMGHKLGSGGCASGQCGHQGHGGCATGNCGGKALFRHPGGGSCATGNCGGGGGEYCDVCGKKHSLLTKLFHRGNGGSNGEKPNFPVVPPGAAAYPGMNREDAVRYLEGFQYYPPYHLMRSPRDFYMWDTKYDLGR